jgi:ketosteroid isomerase-like protein
MAPAATDALGVVSSIFASLSRGAFDEALTLYADDHDSVSGALGRVIKGKAALKDLWLKVRAAFPDTKVKAKRILDAGAVWIVQGVMSGTHQGQFRGVSPTGRPVGAEFVWFLTNAGGKIVRTVAYTTPGALLKQMGAIEGKHPIPAWPDDTEVVRGDGNATNIATAGKVYQAISKADFAVVDANVLPDASFIDHGEGLGPMPWPEYRALAKQHHAAFPDMTVTPEVVIGVGDFVVARLIATGTNKGDMGPMKATGKKVTVRFADVIRFDGAKAKRVESYADVADILGQLGVLKGVATAEAQPSKGE